MKKQILSEEFKRMQKLAGLTTENSNNSLEGKMQQWVNNNAGGYGPEENDKNSFKFNNEMNLLLNNTLEDFNPDNYGDDTSMSPADIVEDFINGAIDIIGKYTMGYYGDDTSFSPDDIKDEFYEFIGNLIDRINESNQITPEFDKLKKQQTAIKKQLSEGALLNAITPGLEGEVKQRVEKLESYLETLGVKLDYKKLGYIITDIIDAAQHEYEMMRNRD